MRDGPRIEIEPVSWAADPMFWVLCEGAVVGTVIPMPELTTADGRMCWLASACDEAGGASWPCASQAAAIGWLMDQAR